MADKYEDLADDIKQDRSHGPITGLDGETYALRWLDEHPDQVPGLAITESRVTKAFGPEYMAWARMCMSRIGIPVVPDPEPTNAEKLAADLRGIWDGHQTMNDVVQWLNDNGWVKAPEGDNGAV